MFCVPSGKVGEAFRKCLFDLVAWRLPGFSDFLSGCSVNSQERGMKVSDSNYKFVYFPFRFSQVFCLPYFSALLLRGYKLGISVSSWWMEPLSLHNVSRSLVIFFALKSPLSDIHSVSSCFPLINVYMAHLFPSLSFESAHTIFEVSFLHTACGWVMLCSPLYRCLYLNIISVNISTGMLGPRSATLIPVFCLLPLGFFVCLYTFSCLPLGYLNVF